MGVPFFDFSGWLKRMGYEFSISRQFHTEPLGTCIFLGKTSKAQPYFGTDD